MIHRLLIANRGEIAVRISRTAARLGIDTVAVYSDADAGAPHVDAADLAVALGGRSAGESYLRGDAVIDAAVRTGCDAVHPGYGFLAENAGFAAAVVDAGLVWVGPTAEQMALLGDKLAAKRTALEAGVPTSAPVAIDDDGASAGELPAYPLLVKAAGGGGGRGMRVVPEPAELAGAVRAARREAVAAFGDATVFIEPFVERGRHVEVQILGDRHGSVVHLGERECSIQRRNQKLIEEAPSPGIDDATRRRLLDGAVALARHVGYESAGTVEFLVDGHGGIHFLEVNARLQVEHPVTEATTGLDLVALQLRIAAGEPLGITQDDVVVHGHAIEARLVAEDPAAGWLPSTGVVHHFQPGEGVRVDSGIAAGTSISPDYDSLLAKVIAHAPSRQEAVRTLAGALARTALHGPVTNVAMLVNVLREASFRAGATFTDYLTEHADVLDVDDDRWPLHLVAAIADVERTNRASDRRWGFAPSGWRNLPTQPQRTAWRRDGADELIHAEHIVSGEDTMGTVADGESVTVRLDGDEHLVRRRHDPGAVTIELDGVRTRVAVRRGGDAVWTNALGAQHRFVLVDRFADHESDPDLAGPVAPLPGTIVAIEVAPGEHVAAGATLIVLEAMKMEHRIAAPAEAIVDEVRAAVGDRVEAGQVLVTFAPHTPDGEAS